MSGTLTRPDWAAAIKDLARRVGILERRTTPPPPVIPAGHTHDGTGIQSTVIPLTSETSPQATGDYSTAVGEGATASGTRSTAVGENTDASGSFATAVGDNSTATADDTIALGGATASAAGAIGIGHTADATHAGAVALGNDVVTTAADQVNIGTSRLFVGTPNSAAANGDLANSQVTFYLNQGSNTLVVKAKYSNGTVKTGTVALT